MSDWSGKWRPALERIACMVGKGKGLPYLPSGAVPNFTDHDICHAVASARRTMQGKTRKGKETRDPLPSCVRPEILELCYAGDYRHVFRIARAAADAVSDGKKRLSAPDVVRCRNGALIAARSLAGRTYTADDLKRIAWSIACNYEALEDWAGKAKAWVEGERYEAATSFLHALKSRLDSSVHEVSAYQTGVCREARETVIRRENPRLDDISVADKLAGRDLWREDDFGVLIKEISEGKRRMSFGVLALKDLTSQGG